MRRQVIVMCVAAVLGAGLAGAQERDVRGRVEVGAFPGGGLFFTQSRSGAETNFGNYAIGASALVNLNRWTALEWEGGESVGVHQSLAVQSSAANRRSPSTLSYNGDLVVHPAGGDRALVPYVLGGLGGLTLCPWGADAKLVGITRYENFLTANLGAGVKWLSAHRFGIRGDYRFVVVKGRDTAPGFFGSETRYGHRLQAGLVFTY